MSNTKENKMTYTITNVIEVSGESIKAGWKNPMVLVTTDKGAFISSAYSAKDNKHGIAFNAEVGDVVEATIAPSKADRYWWISLKA